MNAPTVPPATFADRAATLIHTATADDTVVVATCDGLDLVLQLRSATASNLVQIARAVLEQASDIADKQRGIDGVRLVREIDTALDALPDLSDDDTTAEAPL